ncbi:MAG: hypothetical protein DRP45_11125 [Candidatus Zixiibacteriota bacterium]|nr:MAG: hypothetical protein DRP45_11125 [candidate division Zixibacteria bacterium]
MRLLCLLAILCLPAQVVHSADTEYTISPDSVFRHIVILASDSLEGREVGEPGEWKAAQYITSVFRRLGVEPKGSEGSYLQEFNFIKRIDMGPKNRLEMNGQPLEPEEDFKPLFHSVNAAFEFNEIIDVGYGIINDDSSHNDYEGTDVEGKAVLVRRFTPESEAGLDTTLEQYSSIASKISTALEHKAGGVFFITPEKHDDSVRSTGVMRVKAKDIPIVLLHRRALEKLGLDVSRPSISSLVGETNLVHVRDTGYNVIGYLPGQTESTIVIGAHYDHLGWGGPASRYHGKEKKIHRGADDNGSGVAALLELARRFAPRMDNMRHSLLFIAFSGEEAGLLGSSHFVRNWTVDRDKATMMINMDMIGRLD